MYFGIDASVLDAFLVHGYKILLRLFDFRNLVVFPSAHHYVENRRYLPLLHTYLWWEPYRRHGLPEATNGSRA